MRRDFYVYQLRLNNQSLPFYVGKGCGDRAYRHIKPVLEGKSHKNNIIMKARREGVEVLVEFLREGITENQAFRLERFWIAKIGRYDLGAGPLANHTDGGEGQSGAKLTPEIKEKLSKANRGKIRSRAARDNYSKANAGASNPFFGKTHSEEARRKMKEAAAARRHTK